MTFIQPGTLEDFLNLIVDKVRQDPLVQIEAYLHEYHELERERE